MPDNDERLRGATDEDFRKKWIPGDAVDGGGVPMVGGEELRVVLDGGQVDVPLLCAHQEQVQLVRLEAESSGAVQQVHASVQLDVSEGPVEVDGKLVAVPERVLHNRPVGDPPITGAAAQL